ncbi:MAG: hypothetical protein A2381_12530 [Bdellovibrionales bacterium RIFOXYB1_FULL_37_110]|nr:MAG: hypothetical protein A2181_07255 [Bdellovibrionales bacterium RIFOXYA1_FULL_38_20]OFZ51511.1 MAG: hypothetical protein A2417_12215 [Bdellovibrionales bacterium RIFOXYC1_FULL_37_79]OFZ60345.1 MAG: hypothetical protein A2381_12530 [Bdellovibrionales bacterium RIFOXYB1_FULL_37_110]OFZ63835.1 MAG: hypothetical protein A2577_05445 [Bdellovibrionales bacterium RIFOXYD1_FULL_36_51]
MKKEKFSVVLQGENLVFSSAHFLTYDKKTRENLHGHNFKVSVEVSGHELHNSMVIDFVILEKIVMHVISELKDKLLIAQNDKNLRIEMKEKQINIYHHNETLSLPSRDCVLLPINNCSTELIASYIGKEINKMLPIKNLSVKIGLEEAVGCVGTYEMAEGE